MTSSENSQETRLYGYAPQWDVETLQAKWLEFLEALIEETQSTLPLKRVRYQMEQHSLYQEILRRWAKMDAGERINSWKQLLESSEEILREMLPVCVRCGECCRKGSPTLHMEDLELLRQEKIPWSQLITLRRGEPVRSPFKEQLFFLLDERIKIREKDGSQECVFLHENGDQCTIYSDRPIQCRAQGCWDPDVAKQLSEQQPYLTRRDIFAAIELLVELMTEHDRRCAFEKLHEAFKRLEDARGETVQEVLDLMAYEDHFRHFLAEKLRIPLDTLDLVFGRSFAELALLFGFRVDKEPDGSRCLVLDRS